MLTRCPHCRTLYRIRAEQHKTAGGQARCCRCDRVFNIRENLQGRPPSTLEQDSDLAYIAEVYRLELKDIEASAPENAGPAGAPDQPPDEPHPDAGLLSVEDLLAPPRTRRNPIATLLWSVGSLLLLALMLGQLAWFQRERLVRYPQGRLLLERLCAYAGCSVPQLRDTGRIQVISRQVSSHPHEKDALLVRLVVVNRAPFPQPYPLLELSLSAAGGRVVARRSFTPEEYLHGDEAAASLMPPGASRHIEMEIADPGPEITGFEFDFR